jgi:glycosyltransferase involved in cell wall biosynthesis
MEVRDLWPSVPIAMGYLKNPLVRTLAVALERLAYRRASKIIALSQDMADGVKKAGSAANNISVIPNMSDTKRFRIGSSESIAFNSRYPMLANRPFVVYTGTFGRVNGLEYMAKLALEYSRLDPSLAFVAMGEGAEKQEVMEKASSMGVLDRNFFVFDPIPKKDLPMVLSQAIACSSWVMPIKELEGNSANKLFDAFAAGKPMIINHGGWQKDLLESSGAGLALSPTNLTSAAEELSMCLSDQGWLNDARLASARLGEQEFEVEKLYGEFASVLEAAYRARAIGVESKAPSATDRASQ